MSNPGRSLETSLLALLVAGGCQQPPRAPEPLATASSGQSQPTASPAPTSVPEAAGCPAADGPCRFDPGFLASLPTGAPVAAADALDDTAGCTAVFYLDATAGDDSRDGRSQATAWRNLVKVEAEALSPGSCVLFKRGESWNGSKLEIKASGEAGKPIVLGAYGTGPRPILSARSELGAWQQASSWTAVREGVWRIDPKAVPGRLWVGGQEYLEAADADHLDLTHPWFYDRTTGQLLVSGTANPAGGLKIEISGNQDTAIQLAGVDHVTLRHLDVRGGSYGVGIFGSGNVILEYCDIGRDAGVMGVFIGGKDWPPARPASDDGVIRYCLIDSGDRLRHDYDRSRTEDGIHLRGSASRWEIHGNEIRDWGHTGVSLFEAPAGTLVSYNKIYSNLITSEDVSYGRGVSTMGRDGACKYNEFYNNRIVRTSAANQIGGDHNSFHSNLVDTVTKTVLKTWGGDCLSVTTSSMEAPFVSTYNRIAGNLLYGCDSAGVRVEDYGASVSIRFNTIEDNLIVNTGLWAPEYPEMGLVVRPPVAGQAPGTRNNVYRNNLLYTKDVGRPIFYRDTELCVSAWNAGAAFGDTVAGNVQRDPGLVNAGGVFSLSAGSGCARP